ncbi:MAG: beta-ketoacyl synthase N-terminal-like domain-containing protein, partial [Burkholderiales bacterium]
MSGEFDIAIVGMSGRFPGARDLEQFWRNLAQGVESITRFSDRELLESGVPAAQLRDPGYVKAAPILDRPGDFDAEFFGYSPMEASTMDPQHRLLLELAHEALEHAGCDPDRYPGRVGVFTGAALNTYFTSVGLSGRLAQEYIPTLIGNDKDFLSTRISYKLNLRGPSVAVQSACSSSMVAVHLACQSLLGRETDMALAGAVSVRVPHRAGYFCDGGGVVSADGQVRAFDAAANGTVFGSGGGILVLKRLADALAEGDAVHAVIKGSAVNNDGSAKAGFTAPSVDGQADAVAEALANAEIGADSIGYVEAHGSGTPIG